MAEKRKNPTAEALENNAAVAETNVPDPALDAGVNNVDAADTDAKSRQSDDGNSNPGETREEQSKRLHQERLASFEYADNYRKKLKKDAEERPMTPAQRRKKAEKEALIAKEKEEKERAAREAIEEEIRQEKEEARRRAENASNLLEKVEKSLAEKKAQEEAEKAAMEAPAEEPVAEDTPVEEAPAEEPVAEDVPAEEAPAEEPVAEDIPAEEAPAEEPVAEDVPEEEAPAEEPVAEETPEEETPAEEPESMVLDLDPDNLYGDEEGDDDGMGFTYEYEHPEEEPEEERESMILTYEVDNITYGEIPEDETPAPAPAPMPEPMPEPSPAPAPAPAPAAPATQPKKKKRRKKKPKKAVRTPKKARAIRKPTSGKPTTNNVYNTYNNINNEGDISNITGEGVNDDIARLLAENRDLLKENLDELRRRAGGIDDSRLADVSPASADSDNASETPEGAGEGMLEDRSPESLLADPAQYTADSLTAEDVDIEAPAEAMDETDGGITKLDSGVAEESEDALADSVSGPETVVIGGDNGPISQNAAASKVITFDALTGTVDEIPDSEHIVNYVPRGEGAPVGSGTDIDGNNVTYITNNYQDGSKDRILGIPGDEAAGLGMLGAFSALHGLGKSGLAKKIRDNDKVVRNLRNKLREANKKYTYARTREEKLDSLTECAEYERSIIEFNSESLAATKALGRDTEARKRSLQRDVNKYNGYAKKLEKIALNPITRASSTLPDDILAGREVKRLPQILEKDMYEDGSERKEKSPLSYVSQLDNDDDGVLGGNQSGARKGRKGKKYKISKRELRKSASELRRKLKDNERNLKEHKEDYKTELRSAENTEHGTKTKHIASALNHQREVIAVLGDSYCAAIRSKDKAKARKLNSRLDKEIEVYNKLAKELEKRSGQTIKQMTNTYAKDLADNVKTNLPPLIRYGTTLTEGTFTDSEDITKLDEIIVTEAPGSEKIVQLGQETRTATPQGDIIPLDGGLAPISVFPPVGQDGQVMVVGESQADTPTTFINASPASGYQISEVERNAQQEQQPMVCFPASYLAGQGMIIPGLTGVPMGQTPPTVTIPAADRPLSERIVEAEGSAKTIPGKSEGLAPIETTGATFIGAAQPQQPHESVSAPGHSYYGYAVEGAQGGEVESATINKEEKAREEQIVRPYTARITETPDSAKVIGGWMDSVSESADAEAQVQADGVIAVADKHIDDLIQEENIEELVERTGFEAMPATEEIEELMIAKEEKKKERATRKVITNFDPNYDPTAETIEDTEHYSRAATDVVSLDSDEVLDADEAVARARAAYATDSESSDEADESIVSEYTEESDESRKASAESIDETGRAVKSSSESSDEVRKSEKASSESSDEARKSEKTESESADESVKAARASAEAALASAKAARAYAESADEAAKSIGDTTTKDSAVESTDDSIVSDKSTSESDKDSKSAEKSGVRLLALNILEDSGATKIIGAKDEKKESEKATFESDEDRNTIRVGSAATDEARKSEKASSESYDEARESVKASSESTDEARDSVKASSESSDEARESVKASSESYDEARESVKASSESTDEARDSVKASSESSDEARDSVKASSESSDEARESEKTSDEAVTVESSESKSESEGSKSEKATSESADEARKSDKASSESSDEARKSDKASSESSDETREGSVADYDRSDARESTEADAVSTLRPLAPHIFEDADATRVITAKGESATSETIGSAKAKKAENATSESADEAGKSEKATSESADEARKSEKAMSKSDDKTDSESAGKTAEAGKSESVSADKADSAAKGGKSATGARIIIDHNSTKVIQGKGDGSITVETIGTPKTNDAAEASSVRDSAATESAPKAASEAKDSTAAESAPKAVSEAKDSAGERAADSHETSGEYTSKNLRPLAPHIFEDADSTRIIAGKGDITEKDTSSDEKASHITAAILADTNDVAGDASHDSRADKHEVVAEERYRKASESEGEMAPDSRADKREVVSEDRYRKADESASHKPAERYIKEIPSEAAFKNYEDESSKEAADFAKEAADAAKAAADAAKEAAEYAKEAVRTAKENAAAVAAEQALARENAASEGASSENAPAKTAVQYADGQIVEGLRPLTPFIFEDVDSTKIIPGTPKVTEENAEVVAAAIAPTFASEAAAFDYADKIDYNNYESAPATETAEARSEEKAAPAADGREPATEEKPAREETVVHGKEAAKADSAKADSDKASADSSDKASADSSDKSGAEEKDASAAAGEEAKNRNEIIGHYVPRIYEDVDAMMIIPGRAAEEAVAEENDVDLAAVILPVKEKDEAVAATDSDEKSAAEYAKEAAEYAKEAARYAKEAVSLAKQKEQPNAGSAEITESESEKALAAATEASEAAAVMADKAAGTVAPENKKDTSDRPYLDLVSGDSDITVEAPEASDASGDEASADAKNVGTGNIRPRIPLIFEDTDSIKIIPGRKSEEKASGLKDISVATIVEEKSDRMSEGDQISRASVEEKSADGMGYDSPINYAKQQADKAEEASSVTEPKAEAVPVAEAKAIPEPKAEAVPVAEAKAIPETKDEAKEEEKPTAKLEAIERNAPATCPFYDLIKESLEGKEKASEPASAPVAEAPAKKAEPEQVEAKKAEPEKTPDSEIYVIDDETFNKELTRPTVENDAVESPMFDSIDVVSAPVNKDGYGEAPAEETPAITGDYDSDGEVKSEKPFGLYPRIYEDTDSTKVIPGTSEDPKAELHAAIAAYLAARGIDVGEEGQVTIEEIEDFINSGASLQDWIASDIENRLRPRTPLIFEDADSTKIIPGIKAEEPAEAEAPRAVPIPLPLMDVETDETPAEEAPVADAPVAEAPVAEAVAEETPEEESVEAIVAEVAPGTGVIIADVVIINNNINGVPAENTAAAEPMGDYNADDEDEKAEPAVAEAPAEPLAHADIIDNNVKTEPVAETEEKDYYGYMPKIIEDHDLTMVIKADLPEVIEEAPAAVALDLSEVKLAHADEKAAEAVKPEDGYYTEAKLAHADAIETNKSHLADAGKANEVAPVEGRLASVDLAHAESKVLDTDGSIKGKIIETRIARAEVKELGDVQSPEGRIAAADLAKADKIATADAASDLPRLAKFTLARAEEISTSNSGDKVGKLAALDLAYADAKDLAAAEAPEGRLANTDIARPDAIGVESVEALEGKVAESHIARAEAVDTEDVAPVVGHISYIDVAHAESKVLETDSSIKGKIIETTITRADAKELSEVTPVDGALRSVETARADAMAPADTKLEDGRLADLEVASADAKETEEVKSPEGRLAVLDMAHADEISASDMDAALPKLAKFTLARADEISAPEAGAVEGRLADLDLARAESKVLDTDSSIKGKIIETTIARADAKELSDNVAIEGRLAGLTLATADAKEISDNVAIEGRLAGLTLATADAKEISEVASVEGKLAESTLAHADGMLAPETGAVEGRLADLDLARAESKVLDTDSSIKGKIIETTITRADAKELSEVASVEGKLAESTLAHADGMLAPEAETALPKLAKFTLARAEELESSEAGAVEGRLAEVSLATADSKEISEVASVEGRVADAEIAKADSVTYTEGQAIVGKLAEAVIARADTKELATNEGISGKILETVITRADAKDIADVAPVEGRVADAALAHAKELEVEDSETALPKLAKFTLAKAEEKEIPAEHKPEVVIDDKSNIIPIIINPDDEPISAYLVTDAELIKTSAPEEEGPRQVVEKPEDAISVKAELPPEPTDDQIGEMLLTPPEYDEVDEIDFVPIDFAENEEPIELVKPIETAPEEETPKAEAPAEEAPAEEAPAEPETFVIRANKPAYSIIETTTSDTPDGEHKEVETLVLKRSGYKIIEGGMKIEETPGRTIPGTEDKKYTLKEYEAPKTETAVADVEEITVVDEAPKASAMSIDDEINHPSETIEGAYRRSIPVRILHGKKESFGKGVIGQHIGFHTIADVKDDTVYIRDFAVAYNGVEGIHDINETQKASDERPIAIVDLTRYGNIRSIVIPKSELKDIDNIPGLTDLGFEMKAGRVTFDDESIKSIIHNCADEDIKITFHDGADLDAFGKPVKKALKSQNLVPLSAFSCEINESARDFARGKVKVTIPVEGVTSNDKLVVKYCLDRNTLTDDVFETPYIEREDDDLRKSGTPKVSCKLGHFSYFILTKDVSEPAIGGKVVESEETKVVEKRVLDAAKSAGAYTITEDVREKAPKDEIVTVVDDAPKAEAPKAEEPKAEPVAEPGEVEAHQKEETADDITVEAPESETAEKKPEVIEEPKAEEPKAEPEYSVLTSDYEGEGEKKERSDYGDTIIIKDTDEEAAEEAAPAEEVIEEAAPVEEASEESVAEEPVEKAAEPIKTITKGYILTETPEETKKIRGEGNYLVVEHEASALKIGGKASEEIEAAPVKDAPVAEAKEEAYHEGEEIITVVEDEPVAEAPVHREIVSSEGKVIEEAPKTDGDYQIEEAPDSAKKFEAEKVEVKKGGYILSIDPTQAKKIEGREALASRVKSHDKSELVIASNGEEAPEVTEGYKIGQLDSDAKVISAKEETNGSIMVLDEYTKVVPERETAEEIVSVVEEPAEEPVAEPEKIYTGYILTEDSGKVKVISAKAKPEAEPAPVAEMKVSNLSIIDAPVYEGKETITILDDGSVKDDFAKLTAISEFKSVASDKAPVSDTITVTVTESKPVITEHISTAKVIAASAPEEKAAEVVTPDAIDEPTVVVHDGGFVEEAAATAPAAVKTVAELEGSAKVVEVGKILKAPKSRGAYVISESIGPAKVIGAKEESFDTEGLDVVYDDDITILAAPKNDEPTVEPAPEKETYTEEPITTIEAEEPKAEPMPDEVVHKTRRRAGYIITEKYNEMKVINREEEPVSEPDLYGDADEELAIPTGIKILNSPKSRENYFLAESKNKLRKADTYEPDVTVEDEAEEFIVSGNKSGKFSIAERHDNKKKVQTVITDFDSPENSLVYEEIGSQRVVSSDRYKLPESPLVYEEIGSERIVSKDSYKLPEGPLVYEEIGSERMVQVEDGFESRVKDSIVEYKGTESIIRGDMPVVDVLIDPYQNNNMGVLTGRSLKRHLSATEKEINRLKFDLKYAKKKRDSFTKAAEKVVAHIAMINNQCLICEYYVERINVCTYSGADELAKRNASTLQGELKRYNDLITEYNEMTNSNIPHADKSITKRVLSGKPYEHLTRISYTFTGTDQAPLKAKKSFKGKVVQENRYLADIKLLNRRDEETANDLSLIDNRYKFETALLEGEKEIMEYKFAKNSIANDKRKAYINRKLKSLEREKAKAMKYEGMDNDRYYRVLLTDTNLASYSDNNSKKKRVNSIIYEMGDLLKKRDELNSKLNAIYSGPLGDIAGVGESDKWREVKVNAAKRHARKLRSKAHALKNSVPGFGDKKAKQVFTFNSLLDAKVEALATIDLCKYRLKKEKNNLFNKAQIKKDMREARRTVKLINREIKDRKKMILDDHYGPDASNDFIAIIALAIIAVIGGIAFAHFYTDIDVLGILGKLKSMVGPLIQRVIEIVKTYLG